MQHIPPPDAGWQFFQTPLYYLISAQGLSFLASFMSVDAALPYLKVIPLLCGALQIELSYRLVKLVYPKRYRLQIMGIMFGGFLPMNLFISQFVGNEPLAGLLGGLCILIVAQKLRINLAPAKKEACFIGVILGLAILSKVSNILLVVPIFLLMNGTVKESLLVSRIMDRRYLVPAGIILTTAVLVCSWYFIYCYAVSGNAFWSGWDGSTERQWWQDAGFRTIAYYTHFGSVFVHPVFAGIHSFWDGIYATLFADGMMSGIADPKFIPPWNYPLMQITSWLSVIPAVLVICGLIFMFKAGDRSVQWVLQFCGACLVTFTLAILYMSLIVPTYSAVKSTYALACIPAMALLMAAGADYLSSTISIVRNGIFAALILWCLLSYGTVFVIAS